MATFFPPAWSLGMYFSKQQIFPFPGESNTHLPWLWIHILPTQAFWRTGTKCTALSKSIKELVFTYSAYICVLVFVWWILTIFCMVAARWLWLPTMQCSKEALCKVRCCHWEGRRRCAATYCGDRKFGNRHRWSRGSACVWPAIGCSSSEPIFAVHKKLSWLLLYSI